MFSSMLSEHKGRIGFVSTAIVGISSLLVLQKCSSFLRRRQGQHGHHHRSQRSRKQPIASPQWESPQRGAVTSSVELQPTLEEASDTSTRCGSSVCHFSSRTQRQQKLMDAMTQTNRHWFADDSATQTNCSVSVAPASPTKKREGRVTLATQHDSATAPVSPLPQLIMSPVVSETSEDISPRTAYDTGVSSVLLSQAERQLRILVEEINSAPSNPRSWMCLYRYLRQMPRCAVLEISRRNHLPALQSAVADKADHQLLLEPLEDEVLALLKGSSTLEQQCFDWKGASIVLMNVEGEEKKNCGRFKQFMVSDSDSDVSPCERATDQLVEVLQKHRYLFSMGKGTQFPELSGGSTVLRDKSSYVDSVGSVASQGLSLSATSGIGILQHTGSDETDLLFEGPTLPLDVHHLLDSLVSLRQSEVFDALQHHDGADFFVKFNQLVTIAQRLRSTRSLSSTRSTSIEEEEGRRTSSCLTSPRRSGQMGLSNPRVSPLPTHRGRVTPTPSTHSGSSPMRRVNVSPRSGPGTASAPCRPMASPRSKNVFVRLYTPPRTPRSDAKETTTVR